MQFSWTDARPSSVPVPSVPSVEASVASTDTVHAATQRALGTPTRHVRAVAVVLLPVRRATTDQGDTLSGCSTNGLRVSPCTDDVNFWTRMVAEVEFWTRYATENLAAAREAMRMHRQPSRNTGQRRKCSASRPEPRADQAARLAAHRQHAAAVDAARVATDRARHAERVTALTAQTNERRRREDNSKLFAPLAKKWQASRPLSAPSSRRVRSDSCQIGIPGRVVTALQECWPDDSYAVHMARQAKIRRMRTEQVTPTASWTTRKIATADASHISPGAAHGNSEHIKFVGTGKQSSTDRKQNAPKQNHRMVNYNGCGESVRVGHYTFGPQSSDHTYASRLAPAEIKEKLAREGAIHAANRERVAKRVARRERALLAAVIENYTPVTVHKVRPVGASVVCSVLPQPVGCIIELSHDSQHDVAEQSKDRPVQRPESQSTTVLTVTLRQTGQTDKRSRNQSLLTVARDWISDEELKWTGKTLQVLLPVGTVKFVECR